MTTPSLPPAVLQPAQARLADCISQARAAIVALPHHLALSALQDLKDSTTQLNHLLTRPPVGNPAFEQAPAALAYMLELFETQPDRYVNLMSALAGSDDGVDLHTHEGLRDLTNMWWGLNDDSSYMIIETAQGPVLHPHDDRPTPYLTPTRLWERLNAPWVAQPKPKPGP